MGPVTLKLAKPIEAHGETVVELVLAEPCAKHMRDLPLSGTPSIGLLLDMAAAVSGVPPSAIDQLGAADTMKVVEVLSGFLGGGTGEMPSS